MPKWEYSKLFYDEKYIYYTIYQIDSPYTQQKRYNDALWSQSLNALGLIGWEAIGTTGTLTGLVWYFKRVIDPSNDALQL